VVTINVGTITENHKITVTEEHPIMLNGEWHPAKDAREGMTVGMLSSRCSVCDKPVPWWRTQCSNECHGRLNMTALRKNEEWMKKSRDAQRLKMHEIYSDPIKAKAQTTAANIRTRESVVDGTHPFQRPDNHTKANRKLATDKYSTFIEKKMAWLLDQKGLAYERNRSIKRNEMVGGRRRFYLPDFTLPNKIIIECDGERWHDPTSEYERNRENFLTSLGFTVLHFNGERILNDLASCSLEIDRVLANHEHRYEFMAAPITSVSQWTTKKSKMLYNLSVDEDESYIAKGFVVHNCVRRFQSILTGVRITAKQEELLPYHQMLMKAEVGLLA
jgi:very-short-patch-repair endonuclease/predicted nucleic acid-binding Zn ribbon protein